MHLKDHQSEQFEVTVTKIVLYMKFIKQKVGFFSWKKMPKGVYFCCSCQGAAYTVSVGYNVSHVKCTMLIIYLRVVRAEYYIHRTHLIVQKLKMRWMF